MSLNQRHSLNQIDQSVQALIDAAEIGDQNNRRMGDGDEPIAPAQSLSYPEPGVTFHIEHPGGGICDATVCVRRLWTEGAALIHLGFLHAGTRCELRLRTLDELIEPIPARVRWCRHIARNAHDVSLVFDEPIDLGQFVRDAALVASVMPDRSSPERIAGNAVCLFQTEAECCLVQHLLQSTRLEITSFVDPGHALDHIKRELTHVLICDLDLVGEPGEEVIRAVRATGYDIAILAMSADAQRFDAAREAGAGMVLSKPYDAASLLGAVQTIASTTSDTSTGPIHSTLAGDEGVARTIVGYVEHVGLLLRSIREQMGCDDYAAVRGLVVQLKGGGHSFGFDPLTDAAANALKMLDATCSIEESRPAIEGLIAVARRLTPPEIQEEAA